MALSATWEQTLLNLALGQATLASANTLYCALFTTTPTMPGNTGGVEVSGGSYARQAMAFSAASGSGPAQSSNSALVTFPTATASWGTITGMGLYTASSGGTLVDATSLSTSKAIGSGDVFAVPIGNYIVNQQ
jgi:hypothetical protein